VVVDVRLALVLVAWVLVLRVLVVDGRMVVLVIVSGGEMAPVLAVGQVMHDVVVSVAVHHVLVLMAIRHGALLRPFLRFYPDGLVGRSEAGWGRMGADRPRRWRMGFKTGLLVGFGIGYVLGTKAGRERYEELKASWDQFMGNPSVQRVVTRGKEVVEAGARRGIRAVEDTEEEAKGRLQGPSTGTS
jgi:hypothetical protein